MTILLILIGFAVGAASLELGGGLLGGGLGYLLATVMKLNQRVGGLETEVVELRRRLSRGPATAPEGSKAEVEPEAATAKPDTEPVLGLPLGREREGLSEPAVFEPSFEASQDLQAGREQPEQPARLTYADSDSKTTQPPSPEAWIPSFSIRSLVENYLTSGNLLVKVGVILLFIGVAFLLRYAAERNRLPIELRLIGVALGGMALLVFGWRLRERRRAYALVLQGGGVGVLYLTIFGAMRLYGMIPAPLAFFFLAAMGVFSAALAVWQDSLALAVLGIAGGFLAPVLTSTGSGSHVLLFSYFALLNSCILGIAWFKAWRILNLIGFVFTFSLASTWGAFSYRSDHFATTEPFLILFFLFYVGIAILFAMKQPPQLKGYIDGTIVFGVPIISFGLQSVLVQPYAYGMAWSAFTLGLFYLGVAWALFLKGSQSMRALTEAFLAIGAAFGTLTIPLALDNRWTAAAWAMEGAALVWVGVRQERLKARISGMALQAAAGVAFLNDMAGTKADWAILNGHFLGCLAVSFAGLFSAFYLYRHQERVRDWESKAGIIAGAWGLLWWYGACLNEIDLYAPASFRMGAAVLFLALSSLLWDEMERRLTWPFLSVPSLGLLPALLPALWVTAAGQADGHPFGQAGIVAWPVALALLYFILYRHEGRHEIFLKLCHMGALWLIAIIAAWELNWQARHWIGHAGAWSLIAWGFAPALLVFMIAIRGASIEWPVRKWLTTYLTEGAGPIAFSAWAWALGVGLYNRGDPWPLPYLPIINPLDIAVGFVFVSLLFWFVELRSMSDNAVSSFLAGLPTHSAALLFSGSIFWWLNGILARTVYYWGGVGSYSFRPMFQSVILQTSLSIFWSLTALCVMVFSARKKMRAPWFAGSCLMAVVVLKLFLIDLSKSGTVERIISFLGVGVLLLIIGYLSPVPPAGKEEATAK